MSEETGRYIDPKLSRGLVRQELRQLTGKLENDVRELIQPAVDLSSALLNSGKITEETLRGYDRHIRELRGKADSFLAFEIKSDLRSLSKAKRSVQLAALAISPDASSFQVACVAVQVSRSSVKFAHLETPLEFTPHIAERLLQRRRHELTAKPVRAVGEALFKSLGAVCVALRTASALPERRLAIPFEDGLILGEVFEKPTAMIGTDAQTIDREGDQPIELGLPAFLFSVGKSQLVDFTKVLKFVAKTFIGPREMRPDQIALRERMLEISRVQASGLAEAVLHCACPHWEDLTVSQQFASKDYKAGDMDAAQLAYEDLLRVPGWAKAMGNSGPAPESTPRAKETEAWCKAEHERETRLAEWLAHPDFRDGAAEGLFDHGAGSSKP